MAKTLKEMEVLETQSKAMENEMNQTSASPFQLLPDDEIFLACLPPSPVFGQNDAPLLLTQLSRRTRRIALESPRLWAAIEIGLLDNGWT